MIKAISGAQTGADIASLDAALSCGFQTGGTMPYWFQNETGKHPEFEKLYGMQQNGFCLIADGYRQRTRINVQDSECTVWFEWRGDPVSPGFKCTRRACEDYGSPLYVFGREHFGVPERHPYLISRLTEITKAYDVVNFAGNRASKAPGIYDWVYGVLVEGFQSLNSQR